MFPAQHRADVTVTVVHDEYTVLLIALQHWSNEVERFGMIGLYDYDLVIVCTRNTHF